MPPHTRTFLYALYVLLSEKVPILAPVLFDLLLFYLFSMFISLSILHPLPPEMPIVDMLVFIIGNLAAALAMQLILHLLRRPRVRAHWVEPNTRPHRR